jgi:Domain of unknown function (DUF4382)
MLIDNAKPGDFAHGQFGDLGLKLKTKAAAYGVAGLALAGVVILSGSALGLLSTRSFGVLSVLLTDPPSVPEGVTAVYMTYSDVAVHAAGFNDPGWVSVSGQGTIDAMELVNLSQTISSGTIPSYTYDQVRFTISNVMVEFGGENYTTAISSGTLEVPIAGGLNVNSSSPAATIIDIQPTVLNLGDQSSPSFAITAGASALQVPSGDLNQSTHVVGYRTSLEGHGWYDSFKAKHSEILSVSGTALSSSSFSFSATNEGSDSIAIRTVVIAPGSIREGENYALGSVTNGAVFAVQADGSLKLLSGSPGEAESSFEESGYALAGGATQQFTYSGTITNLLGNHGIISGTSYFVIISGSETLSVQTVTAS